MQIQMKMPDLTTNESAIRIVRWLVAPGARVSRGQALVEVETDKATMEVESSLSGVLQETLCQADEEVSVGQAIAVFQVDDAAAPGPATSTSGAAAAVAPSAGAASAASAVPPAPGPATRRRVGMFARNRAAAADTTTTPCAPAPQPGVALSVAQRTAARRLQESKQSVPHFYLQTSFNASAIRRWREMPAPEPLLWDAFFVRAAALALNRFERLRCRLENERLVPAGTDAIGVAIDVGQELFVIPVTAPAGKTVAQISQDIRRGVGRLRSGDQEIRRIHAALMTITNLGVCNVEHFIPIINPPEAAILGVGKAALTPVARDDGTIGTEYRCTITLSVDHRVASGRYAAQFLEAIVNGLENPA